MFALFNRKAHDEVAVVQSAEFQACVALANQTVEQVASVLLGKTEQIKLSVACILAGGHLLIEDVPGVGKTTLSHALSQALGLQYSRIQFTSDLLPGDILGSSVFDRESQTFVFHPGPIFSQLVLADEVNRAGPKAQSALLEAMEERQVSIEGLTRALPDPFFVIATQNPSHQLGTFPLPESQLDRFLMCISLGYPDEASEKAMMQNPRKRKDLLPSIMTSDQLKSVMHEVERVHLSESLIDYTYRIIRATREGGAFEEGLSPRCALGLLNAARSMAILDGRDHALPDDVQAVFPFIAQHRLRIKSRQGQTRGRASHYSDWLKDVPVVAR